MGAAAGASLPAAVASGAATVSFVPFRRDFSAFSAFPLGAAFSAFSALADFGTDGSGFSTAAGFSGAVAAVFSRFVAVGGIVSACGALFFRPLFGAAADAIVAAAGAGFSRVVFFSTAGGGVGEGGWTAGAAVGRKGRVATGTTSATKGAAFELVGKTGMSRPEADSPSARPPAFAAVCSAALCTISGALSAFSAFGSVSAAISVSATVGGVGAVSSGAASW